MIRSQRFSRWCALHGNLFGVVPVIVHQMAKVGSSAVFAAVSASGVPAWQVHRMDGAHLARMRRKRQDLGWRAVPIPDHDLLGLRIRRQLLDRGGRARIITLVRDPIARNLSSYFEHLDSIWQMDDAHERVPLPDLVEGFHARFPHEEPFTWFEDEMLPVTGIDVYGTPFPADGHVTIRKGPLDLLILKTELSDGAKTAALRAFLGIDDLQLTTVNQTAQKPKGEVYRRFVEAVRLDDRALGWMLESRYVRHFYAAEREAMRQRYSRYRSLSTCT